MNKVYSEYKAWEDANLDGSWKIQSASRGEIDENLRYELKLILSKIRDIDFDVLNGIYKNVKDNIINVQDSVFMKTQRQRKEKLILNGFKLIREYY